MAKQVTIKKIRLYNDPFSVKFFVSEKTPVKVIQIEKKQLLVALKNVHLHKKFKIEGKKASIIRNVGVEEQPGNVIAVVLTSSRPYSYIKSYFNKSDSSYTVNLEKKAAGKSKKPESLSSLSEDGVESGKRLKDNKQAKAQDKKLSGTNSGKSAKKNKKPSLIIYTPPVREKSPYKGDLSDLIQEIQKAQCNSRQIDDALSFLQKEMYAEAFDVLDQDIFRENNRCLEQVYFLRAYSFYKTVKKDDFPNLIKSEQMFQDALVSYPKSSYVPYGYAAIGMIQKKMNNISAAEGYFNIIKQGYLQYSGLSEIMYHLADIYDSKGYQEKALRYYKQVFEDSVENSYIFEAGVGYGKALFKKRQYYDALSVLNYVVKSNPKRVYSSSELLLYIGNANYEVGLSSAAREYLTRVMNLFQDIENPDVILTKIGDTYGMENNEKKAVKIYELVREKYPDTEGYVASSIGIARYMKQDDDKMEIYKMVKTRFPENKYARIAMMRMAEIYQKKREYNNCIQEIEDLLSTHPRGLRYEAVKLMQRAYEALFARHNKANEYTQVLNRYELEHQRIDRMGSRKIEYEVGRAYLEAKLYEEAFNHFIIAYKQYKRAERSSTLLFGLGVAMDESGRDDDALKLFEGFAKRFKRSKYRVEVLSRAGEIYFEKKKYKSSIRKYKDAFISAKKHLTKGQLLIARADVYEAKGDLKTCAAYREKAVKEIALASGQNYALLTSAYKGMGRTYFDLKKYVKSADAYSKALNLSKDDREKANLGFLLGDAYQKGNILSKAKKAYEQVVSSHDSVWSRLAKQRLSTLELAKAVQNT